MTGAANLLILLALAWLMGGIIGTYQAFIDGECWLTWEWTLSRVGGVLAAIMLGPLGWWPVDHDA